MYHFDWQIFLKYIWPPTALQDPLIRNGLIVTIVVSVVAQALGVVLGLFAALGKMSKFAVFHWLSEAYIWYFRGTPLLVQMSLLFFGLGVTHIYDFPDLFMGAVTITGAIQAGTLALGINEGAYMAEIVRAGIESIDPGQMEAAKSLGMTYGLAMQRIVLPQAAKVIIPPLGNEFNNMMKTTSLMVVISAGELFYGFEQVNARIFKPFELFIAASLYYLLLTTIWSFIQSRIESGLGERKGLERGPGMMERLFSGAGGKGAR
ncbi:MAG TPA: amino acid ABC transporter permease [Anaerolineales bacterium]|nr:amino acid ABC transporter permease [Anaerolineales bacterium]